MSKDLINASSMSSQGFTEEKNNRIDISLLPALLIGSLHTSINPSQELFSEFQSTLMVLLPAVGCPTHSHKLHLPQSLARSPWPRMPLPKSTEINFGTRDPPGREEFVTFRAHKHQRFQKGRRNHQLRARRVLSLFNDIPVSARRGLSAIESVPQ